jgi:hypothetical protein
VSCAYRCRDSSSTASWRLPAGADRHEREQRREQDEQHQVAHRERSVEQRREQPRGQKLADLRVRADAEQQVAGGAPVEECVRQRQQVLDEPERHLGVEPGAQLDQEVRADE